MKLAPYVEKLNSSNEFKNFSKKNSDAFMVAGFFILDLELGNNLHQLDYYVPSKKKIAAFTLDKQVTVQLLDLLNSKVPEKLDIKTKIDLDQLHGILEEEMKNRNMTDSIKKIIAVLQNLEGRKIWNLNCILSGMGILNAHVEDESRTVLKMEKKSLMDIMKKMPVEQLRQQLQPSSLPKPGENENNGGGNQSAQLMPPQQTTDDQIKQQIKKLDELEKAIEKEKDELEKEIAEKATKKAAKNTNNKQLKASTPSSKATPNKSKSKKK